MSSDLLEAMNMIGMVESHRDMTDKASIEPRYDIGSIVMSAARFADVVRVDARPGYRRTTGSGADRSPRHQPPIRHEPKPHG